MSDENIKITKRVRVKLVKVVDCPVKDLTLSDNVLTFVKTKTGDLFLVKCEDEKQ
jgi:hypothetical protein